MKAYVLNEAGAAENLLLREIEMPEIKADEVLIETKAISINPVDVKVRLMDEAITMILGTEDRPVILGWDIAGIVVAVGEAVSGFEVGDKVFGMINFPGQGKAYAEYVASPASHIAVMPENVTFDEAAATTLAALTALQVLQPRVKKGDRVLIHAGSGGVGHFAIQIAKGLGAYVIATSSAKNRDFILSLGADEHIDYREQKFEEVLSDIDFVLDGMGGEVLENSLKVVKEGGRIVTLPTHQFSEDLQLEAGQRKVELEFVLVQSSGVDMNTLKSMLEADELKPHVSKIFPFEDMAGAHLQIESGRTVGKVIVKL
ncbi:Bifunctional protein: zinc-containing alcohol dehydrogenase; quinone oxidoreductase (NADPH:quinone reductase); Similar to arginate lyase [Candidatus Nitrotoga sp. BS]|uniref:NADP-dependent oxidoreductase n=1 Tax=Candidatus Nitrotoga sp. BS TaxID=2890408 RepID=UPI001EF3AE50|nr:NADP-dependent oxidoreductase [Candidatus Nitrotoga sp. BS]CAH1208329.1 Bifunctional protein: zinc-containing alcohol dehydrogenase; quinone oxidoreductase (NADPH:quinone reductase); Similar to arginate lyase [Candidatus Nitrotoga sp. BS]